MTTLHNEISINASMEKIWDALSNIDMIAKYDPTVKKATLLSSNRNGIDAKRKVDMLDGKNWFEEKVTECLPNKALTFELTACSFPVHNLKHSYSFEKSGNEIKVKQVMQYEMKFGILGKLMDVLVVRKQSDAGIKKFFGGLKSYTERN